MRRSEQLRTDVEVTPTPFRIMRRSTDCAFVRALYHEERGVRGRETAH
jgi:hypothetical protein